MHSRGSPRASPYGSPRVGSPIVPRLALPGSDVPKLLLSPRAPMSPRGSARGSRRPISPQGSPRRPMQQLASSQTTCSATNSPRYSPRFGSPRSSPRSDAQGDPHSSDAHRSGQDGATKGGSARQESSVSAWVSRQRGNMVRGGSAGNKRGGKSPAAAAVRPGARRPNPLLAGSCHDSVSPGRGDCRIPGKCQLASSTGPARHCDRLSSPGGSSVDSEKEGHPADRETSWRTTTTENGSVPGDQDPSWRTTNLGSDSHLGALEDTASAVGHSSVDLASGSHRELSGVPHRDVPHLDNTPSFKSLAVHGEQVVEQDVGPSFTALADHGALLRAVQNVVSRATMETHNISVGTLLDSDSEFSEDASTCCRVDRLCNKAQGLVREMSAVVSPLSPPKDAAANLLGGRPPRLPEPSTPGQLSTPPMTPPVPWSPGEPIDKEGDLRFRVSRIELELVRVRNDSVPRDEYDCMVQYMHDTQQQLNQALAEIQDTKQQMNALQRVVYAAYPTRDNAPCAIVNNSGCADAVRSLSAPVVARPLTKLWASGMPTVTVTAMNAASTVPSCPSSPPITARVPTGSCLAPGVQQSPLLTKRIVVGDSPGYLTASGSFNLGGNSCGKDRQTPPPLRPHHIQSSPCIVGTPPPTVRVWGSQSHFGPITEERAFLASPLASNTMVTSRSNGVVVFTPARVAG